MQRETRQEPEGIDVGRAPVAIVDVVRGIEATTGLAFLVLAQGHHVRPRHTQGPARGGGAGFFALQQRTCLRGAWGCQKCHCTVDISHGMPWPQQAADWRVALPRMLARRNCSCQPASSNFMDKVIKHVVWSSGQRPRPDAPPERGGVECRQSRGNIVTRFQRIHAEARIQVQGGRQGSAKGSKVSGGGVLGS